MFQCFNLIHIFISRKKCWCKWEGEERWKLGGESVRSSVRRREESKNICSCASSVLRKVSIASYLKYTTPQWIMNSDGTLVWCYSQLEMNLENKEEAPSLLSDQGLISSRLGSHLSDLAVISDLCAANMKKEQHKEACVKVTWRRKWSKQWKQRWGREESTSYREKENVSFDLIHHDHGKPGYMWAAGWVSQVTRCDLHLFTTTKGMLEQR